MATVTKIEHTPEDLLNIRDRPMPELIDDELVEREMGQKSDGIAATILAILWHHVHENRLGFVNGSQGSYQIFPDRPKMIRIPDVSFTRRERIPGGQRVEGHSRVVPDLVIEVVSPNDNAKDLFQKIDDFLKAGVPLIWVVDPDTLTVQVHRIDGTAQRLRAGDCLDGGDIVPGFRCELARIFA